MPETKHCLLPEFLTKGVDHPDLQRELTEESSVRDHPTETETTIVSTNHGKYLRKRISKAVKYEVWEKYNKTGLSGKCYCCSDTLLFKNLQVGHVVAVSRGGDNSVSNLRPICQSCNLGMGVENLEAYRGRLKS